MYNSKEELSPRILLLWVSFFIFYRTGNHFYTKFFSLKLTMMMALLQITNILSHLLLHRPDLTTVLSTIGIWCTSVLSTSLYLLYLQYFFWKWRIVNCHKACENTLYFVLVLPQFHPMMAMSQPPYCSCLKRQSELIFCSTCLAFTTITYTVAQQVIIFSCVYY